MHYRMIQIANHLRAAKVKKAIAAYRSLTGAKRKNAVGELICDLMHHCDRDNRFRSFENSLQLAEQRYKKQTSEPFS